MAPSRRPAPLAAKKAERLIGVGCNCRSSRRQLRPRPDVKSLTQCAQKQRPTVSAAVAGCAPRFIQDCFTSHDVEVSHNTSKSQATWNAERRHPEGIERTGAEEPEING